MQYNPEQNFDKMVQAIEDMEEQIAMIRLQISSDKIDIVEQSRLEQLIDKKTRDVQDLRSTISILLEEKQHRLKYIKDEKKIEEEEKRLVLFQAENNHDKHLEKENEDKIKWDWKSFSSPDIPKSFCPLSLPSSSSLSSLTPLSLPCTMESSPGHWFQGVWISETSRFIY